MLIQLVYEVQKFYDMSRAMEVIEISASKLIQLVSLWDQTACDVMEIGSCKLLICCCIGKSFLNDKMEFNS